MNKIDRFMIYFTISGILLYTLLWKTSQAFIYKLGEAFEILIMFFLVRCLIRDFDDYRTVISALAVLFIPLALSMLIEHSTGRNFFSIFGGVPDVTMIRDGRLRCEGPFSHPILAGTFGATLVPLFFCGLVQGKPYRFISAIGIVCGIIITIMSASSGPVMSLLSGLLAVGLWVVRYKMRLIKIAFVTLLIILQLYMKGPIWRILDRMGTVSGSDSYHRFFLFDQFVKRFNEWALLGVKTTAHWGWGLQDITNQFVLEGTRGGLLTLILFIIIIALCFRSVGKAIRHMENKKQDLFLVWSMGCTLFAHIVSFFGVSYFDQIIVSWIMLLGMFSSMVEAMTFRLAGIGNNGDKIESERYVLAEGPLST